MRKACGVSLAVCVLGVMVITAEYSTGTIRASLLAVPRRLPVLAAKSVVFGLLVLGLGTAVSFASFFTGAPILHSKAPVASPISTPNLRVRCCVSCPGRASELTKPVSVPVRNVVDTLLSPSSLTDVDCTPIAAAVTASSTNSAHPAGRAPVASHPAASPASSMSSVNSAQLTCAGSTLSRSVSSALPLPRTLKPCASQVPPATPMM